MKWCTEKDDIIRKVENVETVTLDELRHLTRSTVKLATNGDVTEITQVDGVHDFVKQENEATFSVDYDNLNAILVAATKLGVKKFEVVPPTLEDLFMRHYKG